MVTGGGAAEADCISRKIVVVGDSGVGKVQPTLSSIADHRPLPILSTQANIVTQQKEWIYNDCAASLLTVAVSHSLSLSRLVLHEIFLTTHASLCF